MSFVFALFVVALAGGCCALARRRASREVALARLAHRAVAQNGVASAPRSRGKPVRDRESAGDEHSECDDDEVIERALAGAELRERTGAVSELVSRIELSSAQAKIERAGLIRIPLLAGGAGAILLLALSVGGSGSGAHFISSGVCLASGAVAAVLIEAESRRRRAALAERRTVARRLARGLDSGPASG